MQRAVTQPIPWPISGDFPAEGIVNGEKNNDKSTRGKRGEPLTHGDSIHILPTDFRTPRWTFFNEGWPDSA